MPVSAPPRPSPGATRPSIPTADTTPDAVLVRLAAGGDERAFELLFRRHRADVLAYATRMLRDHGRAEDVVQDVFVSAMRALGAATAATEPVHVRAWLREIARRACIDQWRGTTRRGEVSLDAPEALGRGDARRLADDDSLARATDDREAVATLRLAFDDLPELQHRVVVQRELEGRPIAEIAARLGVTPTVVEGQLARGRRTLGRAYRELESGERCALVRELCDTSLDGHLGVRDRHRVGRHVRGCDPCRRHAHERGVDPRIVSGALIGTASAFLPLPLLRRLPFESAGAGAGEAAVGGLLGAKVLVGAAVVAAGGGGVYAARSARPVAVPTDTPSAVRGGSPSTLGLRPGTGGGPVLRLPAAGGLAPGAVRLPDGRPGLRLASPYLPPWLAQGGAFAVVPPSAGSAATGGAGPAGPVAPAAVPQGAPSAPATPSASAAPSGAAAPASRAPSTAAPADAGAASASASQGAGSAAGSGGDAAPEAPGPLDGPATVGEPTSGSADPAPEAQASSAAPPPPVGVAGTAPDAAAPAAQESSNDGAAVLPAAVAFVTDGGAADDE